MDRVTLVRETLIDKYDEIRNIPDDLLLLATTIHATPSNNYGSTNYQRLEFLGDSVLGLIVAEYTFNDYSLTNPGQLSHIKGKIVRNATLYCMMNDKKLCEGIEKKSCADMFESILGAIYYYLRLIKYNDVLGFIKLWLILEWNFDLAIDWLIENPDKFYCNETIKKESKQYQDKSQSTKSFNNSPPSRKFVDYYASPSKNMSSFTQKNNTSYDQNVNTSYDQNINKYISNKNQNVKINNYMSNKNTSYNQNINTNKNKSYNQNPPVGSPTKNVSTTGFNKTSKQKLQDFYDEHYNENVEYVQITNNTIGVLCPTTVQCKGMSINGKKIIGTGSGNKEGAENAAAYNALIYLNKQNV